MPYPNLLMQRLSSVTSNLPTHPTRLNKQCHADTHFLMQVTL